MCGLVLDARYNRKFFTEQPSAEFFDQNWVQDCHREFITTMRTDFATIPATLHSPVKVTAKSRRAFTFADPRVMGDHVSSRAREDPMAELQEYLEERRPHPDSNPLDWWKSHAKDYPTLARMARIYLAIPGTASLINHMSIFSTECFP